VHYCLRVDLEMEKNVKVYRLSTCVKLCAELTNATTCASHQTLITRTEFQIHPDALEELGGSTCFQVASQKLTEAKTDRDEK